MSSIQADPDPLSNNLSWVDKIIEDSCVNGHQGAGPGTLLLQLVGLPGGLGQDPPLGDEDHVLSRELLLKLPHQPGLDLLEGLELRDGDEDHDGLLAAGALHLLGCGDVQLSQGGLQVRVHLKVQQGLRDGLLNLVRLLIVGLDDLSSSQGHDDLLSCRSESSNKS